MSTDFVSPARTPAVRYFANAAHGLPSRPVLDALTGYLDDEAELGAAGASRRHADGFAQGYVDAARLIGAAADEIAFVESGNRAVQALVLTIGLVPGDHVLVDRSCWGGTVALLAAMPGVVVDVMPVDAHGRADPVAARATVHPRTRCVLLTACPATSGIVNPLADTGRLAAAIGAWFFVDVCQMLGQIPVDVATIGCHGLAASGRKWLRGPRGTALLYASRALLEAHPAFPVDQFGAERGDARRYETGEACMAGRIALSVAIRGALAIDVAATHARLTTLATRIRDGLRAIDRVRLTGAEESAIVGFSMDGVEPSALADTMDAAGIAIGWLSAPYAPFDLPARRLSGVARVAPQLYTSDAEIDALLAAMAFRARGG